MHNTAVGPHVSLVGLLSGRPLQLVGEFLGPRCTLCDERLGVLVRHADGEHRRFSFDWYCITCSLAVINDRTPPINIHQASGSSASCGSAASSLDPDLHIAYPNHRGGIKKVGCNKIPNDRS